MGNAGRPTLEFLKDSVIVEVDEKVYSLPAILKASYRFTDVAFILFSSVGSTLFVRITPVEAEEANKNILKKLAADFCNELLEQVMREQILQQTGEIRNTIIKRAFASGGFLVDH